MEEKQVRLIQWYRVKNLTDIGQREGGRSRNAWGDLTSYVSDAVV